jgi:UPF0271 protein
VRTLDINSDLGESFGNWRMGSDEELVPLITTANMACGFHASDPVTMVSAARLAAKHGVAIGAHPGLPDLLGFGRRVMSITAADAYAYVLYQSAALKGILEANGMVLHHVKPHGAMYSVLKANEELAAAVAEAIEQICPDPLIYWPAPLGASALPAAAAKRGIPVIGEVYPDLDYAPDGALVIQRSKHHTDVAKACDQVRLFIEEGCVLALDGSKVPLAADSFCIHGDGPNSPEVAKAVRRTIEESGCRVGPVDAAAREGARS